MNMKNKKAKGYSKSVGKYVEGTICHCYANGIGILTNNGIAFVENGKYKLIENETENLNEKV